MVRKQSNQGNNRKNLRKAPPRSAPKPVSPNYRVDMMHHQLAAMKKDSNSSAPYDHYSRQSEQPPRRSRGYHSKPPSSSGPKPAQAKKGYSMLNVEVKEDLYKKFVNKLKGGSKSPKEVMNQLISFYNMGKIKI